MEEDSQETTPMEDMNPGLMQEGEIMDIPEGQQVSELDDGTTMTGDDTMEGYLQGQDQEDYDEDGIDDEELLRMEAEDMRHDGDGGEIEGYQDDDDDAYYDEDDDEVYDEEEDDRDVDELLDDLADLIDPESADMAEVQEQLKTQLKNQENENFLEIKETKNEINKLNAKREQIGVELYSLQQQLAKLQEQYERSENDHKTIQEIREAVDKKRDEFLATCDARKKDLEGHRQNLNNYKSENDKIAAKLQTVERYNQEIQSNIKLKRRETYQTENQMQNKEKEKEKQDLLIDDLNAQLKRLQVDLGEIEQALVNQRKETNVANETLAEATTEMEAMEFEKKQLVQQWKTSIIGMKRRDEAMQNIAKGIEKQEEQEKEIKNEIEGYKQQKAKEQEKQQQIMNMHQRAVNELAHVEKQIEGATKEIDDMHQDLSKYKQSLDQTDALISKQRVKGQKLSHEVASVDMQNLKISNKIRECEGEQDKIISEQITHKKGKSSTVREIEKMRDVIRNKSMELSQIENELARITIDRLQTDNHNDQLKTILAELEKELQERDKLIEKYEAEIKQKHLEIEKKQNHLDKLNRELESLTANQQEENFGPLEATIRNLEKEIDAKTKENEQLNKNWIRNQSELVNIIMDVEKKVAQIKDLKSQITVLTQKKRRLEGQTKNERQDVDQLKSAMTSMHHQMEKLNGLIAKRENDQNDLASNNFDLQNKIEATLKEREREAIQLDQKINDVKQEKSRLINELVETERQIMYWEKKIDIQKEIAETLDPEVGQEEITKMQKEIHIMEQRLLDLKRSKKLMVEEIKKAVSKRDIIMTKGKAQAKRAKTGANDTKANLKREIARLQNTLRQAKNQLKTMTNEVTELFKEAQSIGMAAQQRKDELEDQEHNEDQLSMETQLATLRKDTMTMRQKQLDMENRAMNDIIEGKYRLKSNPSNINDELQRTQNQFESLTDMIDQFRAEPQFAVIQQELEVLVQAISS
mmetsp:Transcript_13470/g.20409  ORF Transcript_13470/g.20409 Transcript_13470/m.20409 type:complete len:984 (+) Transcript_13470:157-3108(+)